MADLPGTRDAELQLAELNQAVIDALPGVFFVFTREGKPVRWNRALEAASGYNAAEISRMETLDFISKDDRPHVGAAIVEAFETGAATVEANLLARDGTETPYCFCGNLIEWVSEPCVIGTGVRISDRRRDVDSLRRSEQQLRTILEQSPISMAIVGMDGTIEYINRRVVETFGYVHEDIPNMDRWWAQAYPDPAYREEVTTQWMGLVHRAIERGQEIERRDYRVTCKDGTVRTMVIFGVVTGGKVFAMFEDITARKEAEEARARAEEQVHRAQRMEALGTLSGGIAHDFNNILMGVMPNAELLQRELPEGDYRRELASEILLASFRARDLVRQILAFARREGPGRRPLQLPPVVDEALKLLHASLPPNIVIDLRVAKDLPPALLEPSQVQQVITNLATNAAHAIGPAGGRIELSIEAVTLGPNDCVSRTEMRPGEFVRLNVRDTGCGMTSETLARAFEPFFTTKPVGQGTGLGLAIVHGIMARHDGFVVAKSVLGEGTSFDLYFHAATASGADAVLPSKPPLKTARRVLRVLLVDDEPLVLRATTRMLEYRGCQVVAHSDPDAALACVRNAPLDVVIVDLAMPGIYGDELARRMHELSPTLPLLLASGNASQLDPERLRQAGIIGLLAKPFDMSEVLEAIDAATSRLPG